MGLMAFQFTMFLITPSSGIKAEAYDSYDMTYKVHLLT